MHICFQSMGKQVVLTAQTPRSARKVSSQNSYLYGRAHAGARVGTRKTTPIFRIKFLSTRAIGIYKLRFVYRGYQHRCQNQALPTSRLGNDSGPSCYKCKGCRYMHICFQSMGKQVVLTAQTHGVLSGPV